MFLLFYPRPTGVSRAGLSERLSAGRALNYGASSFSIKILSSILSPNWRWGIELELVKI